MKAEVPTLAALCVTRLRRCCSNPDHVVRLLAFARGRDAEFLASLVGDEAEKEAAEDDPESSDEGAPGRTTSTVVGGMDLAFVQLTPAQAKSLEKAAEDALWRLFPRALRQTRRGRAGAAALQERTSELPQRLSSGARATGRRRCGQQPRRARELPAGMPQGGRCLGTWTCAYKP